MSGYLQNVVSRTRLVKYNRNSLQKKQWSIPLNNNFYIYFSGCCATARKKASPLRTQEGKPSILKSRAGSLPKRIGTLCSHPSFWMTNIAQHGTGFPAPPAHFCSWSEGFGALQLQLQGENRTAEIIPSKKNLVLFLLHTILHITVLRKISLLKIRNNKVKTKFLL